MIAAALDNLPIVTLLVVLAGSFLISGYAYLVDGDPPAGASQGSKNWRPQQRANAPVYHASHARLREPRRRNWVMIALIAAFGFGAGHAGAFAYQSPWDTETDLRHLAATLHCDLAQKLDLAPALRDMPGYHSRNDRDGNGISCEVYGQALQSAALPLNRAEKLSGAMLVWPE